MSRRFVSSDDDKEPLRSLKNLEVFHLRRTVESTQDETKRLLALHEPKGCLAVIADNQSCGRGTSGRSWVATRGNLFLTCAIPMDMIPLSKLTLLPLGVGLLIAMTLDRHLSCRPSVKWPNDVLVEQKKIAGTLIENHRLGTNDYWLVGIGVNVESYPSSLPTEKSDFRNMPRRATSMKEHIKPGHELIRAVDLGVHLAVELEAWASGMSLLDSAEFTKTWKGWSDMNTSYEIRETGETVFPVEIEDDGRLKVINSDGEQRVLVADYFF